MGGLFKKPKAPKVVVPKQRMPVLNQESEEEKRRRELMAEAMKGGRISTRLTPAGPNAPRTRGGGSGTLGGA